MELLLQIIVNSLITGSLYGVMAMSFALTYRTVRFFNLAHGAMAALGGYMFYTLTRFAGTHFSGVPLPLALLGAAMFAGASGFLIDRFIYALQRHKKASGTVMLVVSLGIVTVIEAILSMIFTTQFRPLTTIADIQVHHIFGAALTQTQAYIIFANLAVFAGLMALLYKTKFGKMLRAISDNEEVARILGIRTNFYIGGMFFIVSALAGMMGALSGLDTGIQPTMGFILLLKGIIAAIIGGAGNVVAAFVCAFLLAFAENLGVWALASEWRDALAFGLLLLFLLFRPQGIWGRGIA